MSLKLAIEDIANVIRQSQFLDRVDSIALQPGSRNVTATITLGAQTSQTMYGKTKTMQELSLTLTVKTKATAAQVAEITKELDKDIVKDRRRNNQAQTTVLNEEGWIPEESTDLKTITTRRIEVHVYEDQV